MTGIELIAAERQRQIDVEGWTAEHDDNCVEGQLRRAAICYAYSADRSGFNDVTKVPISWPWHRRWWKPQLDKRDAARDLIKAGALIAAEIDRILRTGEQQ